MAIPTPRQLALWGALLLVLVYIKTAEQAAISMRSEESNSSSVEHYEASNDYSSQSSQEQQPQKRSTDDAGTTVVSPRISIPGLPDPATILKVAEVLQTVSEQVIPILVEGIMAPSEIVTEHLNRDFKLLKKLKSRLDLFSAIK